MDNLYEKPNNLRYASELQGIVAKHEALMPDIIWKQTAGFYI